MDDAYHNAMFAYLQKHQLHQQLDHYLMHAFTAWGTSDYYRLFWEVLYEVEQVAHQRQLPAISVPLEPMFTPVEVDETFSVCSDDICKTSSSHILEYANQWLNLLLGKSASKRKYTPQHVQLVKAQILAHGIRNRNLLTVDVVRAALKTLGLSKLFNQANYILMDLLGARPIAITSDELILIQDGLAKIAFHYPTVAAQWGKTNMVYIPFLIHKLCEHFAPEKSQELRRYIHFQSHEILHKNDRIWQQLCPLLHVSFKATTLFPQI